MILGRADNGDVQALIIGLSALNIEKLQKGMPIHITREKQGEAIPEHWSIVIMAGETENSMAAELRRAGMLDGTRILKQPENKD